VDEINQPILQHVAILKPVCASLKMIEYAVQATLKEFSLPGYRFSELLGKTERKSLLIQNWY
jgi:hypothetical protein